MVGISWSARSLNLKETLLPFSVTKILVSTTSSSIIALAGLTVGDPVLRTGNPLSVELGPGKLPKILLNNYIRNLKDYI